MIYHEGVGHPIGLPHPEPQNETVMSLAQYRGWLSESSVDESQKKRLGWNQPDQKFDRSTDLFSSFTAIPAPLTPKPDEPVTLKLTWPQNADVSTVRVRLQTELSGPWVEAASLTVDPAIETAPKKVALGAFDRPTPVSYRVDATLKNGETVELWGYFQVRETADTLLLPRIETADLSPEKHGDRSSANPKESIDLLPMIDVDKDLVSGKWIKADGFLESPKQFGARIEIPFEPPAEYELTVVATPLDEPNGLLLGQLMSGHRFVTLVNHNVRQDKPASALENVDGKNVSERPTVTNHRHHSLRLSRRSMRRSNDHRLARKTGATQSGRLLEDTERQRTFSRRVRLPVSVLKSLNYSPVRRR